MVDIQGNSCLKRKLKDFERRKKQGSNNGPTCFSFFKTTQTLEQNPTNRTFIDSFIDLS